MINQEANNQKNNVEQTTNAQPVQTVKTAQPVQPVQQVKKNVITRSYFDGGVLGLIGWRILAFLITIVTLGIAAPWAECLLISFQVKHTVYNGKRLRFKGTGGSLFLNYIKWIFFSIITLGIYTLVIPVKKTKWIVSNTYFIDEECKKGESYFDGNTLQLIGINLLSALLTLISFGLLYPFTVCYKLRWINKHTVINRKRLIFEGSAISLWGHYILWYLLLIITFGIFGLWLPIKQLKWQTKNIHIREVGRAEKKDITIWIAIPILLITVTLGAMAINNMVDTVDTIDFDDINFDNVENLIQNGGVIVKKKETIRFEDKDDSNSKANEATKNTANEYISIPNSSDVYKPVNSNLDADGYTTYVDPSIDYSAYREPYVASAGGVEDVLANTDIVCAPALMEIPGEYIVDIQDTNYNTIQSDVTISILSNGTNLKYNGTVMKYDPSSGYAYSSHDGELPTYDAYFTVLSNGKIKIDVRVDKGNEFNSIIGYKK